MRGEAARPVYVARPVANGASGKQLAAVVLPMGVMALFITPAFGPVGIVLLGALLVLVAVSVRIRRRGCLEWDGQQLHWREAGKRRLVAERGDGWVVRVAFAQTGLGASATPTNFLVWVDRSGRARTPLMPERLWDPVQLDRLRRAAHLAIVDDASSSFKDMAARYPGSVPWYLAKPGLMFAIALPFALATVILFLPH